MNESQPRSENLTGIFLMLASMALFAVEDLFLKLAAADLPIGQIILISGALGMPGRCGWARSFGGGAVPLCAAGVSASDVGDGAGLGDDRG
jgi:hypothetical protein